MSTRSIRRAAERKANKFARRAFVPSQTQSNQPVQPSVENDIEQPLELPGPWPLLPEPVARTRAEANHANAQKSTGPSTEEGKAISSQNHVCHGLARHNGRFAILSTEDATAYQSLLESLIAEHRPVNLTETILVTSMAESHWLRQRAQHFQALCFDALTGLLTNEKSFSLHLRYEATHNRAFYKALGELQKLRNTQRQAELGFEAQRIKTEKHAMKKEGHHWDVMLKCGAASHQISKNALQKVDAMAQDPNFLENMAAEFHAETDLVVNASAFVAV